MTKDQLQGLDAGELEKLRDLVNEVLTEKLCAQVGFKSFEFEPCDDRSMGSLRFEARTKYGILKYSSYLGNGYTDDVEVSLDAKDGEERVGDFLEVPSFHDDTTSDEAKREVVKALLAFEAAYKENFDQDGD